MIHLVIIRNQGGNTQASGTGASLALARERLARIADNATTFKLPTSSSTEVLLISTKLTAEPLRDLIGDGLKDVAVFVARLHGSWATKDMPNNLSEWLEKGTF